MKQVNIIVGRFQPITIGHIKCAIEAFDKNGGYRTVLCMIDTPDSKVDTRHPFPSSMLLPIYKSMFLKSRDKSHCIEDIMLVKNADIVKISEALRGQGYEPISWSCGTDRYDSYVQMAERYKDKAGLPENFKVIEIKRSDDDVSATKLRQALLDDNQDMFFKNFPAIHLNARLEHNIYKLLREQILKVAQQ